MGEEFNLYEVLKQKLGVCYYEQQKREIVIRCFVCGDSLKNGNKGHMYISNKPPFKYYCQKCGSSGIVDEKFLNSLNISNSYAVKNLNNLSVQYKKNLTRKYGENYFNIKKDLKIPKNINKKDIFKLKYFTDRLGIKVYDGIIEKYKIILNLNDFLRLNNLYDITYKEVENNYYKKQNLFKMNEFCIGFLSLDKSVIIFRSLAPEKTNFRYSNYPIFKNYEESKKIYAIKNSIDLSKKVFDVNITEGIFDIFGVYNHIKSCDDNELYFSNNGKSYLVTLNALKDFGIINCNINFYSDNDVKVEYFKNMIKRNNLLKLNGMNLYYNKIDKDFGVTKDKIILSNKIEF